MQALPPKQKNRIMLHAEKLLDRFYAVQAEFRQLIDVQRHARSAASADAVWWRSLELERWFRDRLRLLT